MCGRSILYDTATALSIPVCSRFIRYMRRDLMIRNGMARMIADPALRAKHKFFQKY